MGAKKLILVLGSVIVAYTVLRAAQVSVAHDEALTYQLHVRSSLSQIFFPTASWLPANNHLLNTLLTKLSVHLFGVSGLTLRIPALIGHLFYLVGTYLVLSLRLSGKRLFFGFLIMGTNPFLIDYFSCARGFSLGLGFLMLGYWAILVGKSQLAIFLSAFAALSNVGFLVMYVTLGVLALFQENWRRMNRGILVSLAITALALFIIYNPFALGRILANLNGAGGKSGLWEDSIRSLISATLYGIHYGDWVYPIIGGFIILTLATSIYTMERTLVVTLLILVTPLLIIVSQRLLLKTEYPIGRAVIYLVPLFGVHLLFTWDVLTRKFLSNVRLVSFCFYVPLTVVLAHFISCINFDRFNYFSYDAQTKRVMDIAYQMSRSLGGGNKKFKLGISWQFRPSTMYYITQKKMDWMEPTTRKGPDGDYDLYYVMEREKWIIEKHHLRILATFTFPSVSYLAIPDPSQRDLMPAQLVS